MTKTLKIVSLNMKQTNEIEKTQENNGQYDPTENNSGKFRLKSSTTKLSSHQNIVVYTNYDVVAIFISSTIFFFSLLFAIR